MALGDQLIYRQGVNANFIRSAIDLGTTTGGERDIAVFTNKGGLGIVIRTNVQYYSTYYAPGSLPPAPPNTFCQPFQSLYGPPGVGARVFAFQNGNPGVARGAIVLKSTPNNGPVDAIVLNSGYSNGFLEIPVLPYNGFGPLNQDWFYVYLQSDPAAPTVGQLLTYTNPAKSLSYPALVANKQTALVSNCLCDLLVLSKAGVEVRTGIPYSQPANNPSLPYYTY